MTKDFDNLIKQKQAELDSLKPQMEEVRQQFIKDSTTFIKEWYEKTSQSYVETGADITLNLGKEKLSQMKTKTRKLIENAEATANEMLFDPELWWHLAENDELSYSFYGNAPPRFLDKAIRLALGKLGTILEEFGYSVTTKPTAVISELGVWCEWDSSGRYHPPDARPYYPFSQDWSEAMRNTLQKYNELCTQAKKVRIEINSLQREKKTEEAKNLWDSV